MLQHCQSSLNSASNMNVAVSIGNVENNSTHESKNEAIPGRLEGIPVANALGGTAGISIISEKDYFEFDFLNYPIYVVFIG